MAMTYLFITALLMCSASISYGKEVCKSTTCQHGGQCIVTNNAGDGAVCNCSMTGYSGSYCELGLIRTSDIPLLIAGETYTLTLYAKPAKDLIIILRSDDVTFSPKSVAITHSIDSVDILVTPKTSGHLTINLQLCGSSAYEYPKDQQIFLPVFDQTPGSSAKMLSSSAIDYKNFEFWNGDHLFTYRPPFDPNVVTKEYVSSDDYDWPSNGGVLDFSYKGDIQLMAAVEDPERWPVDIFTKRFDAFIMFYTPFEMAVTLKIGGLPVTLPFLVGRDDHKIQTAAYLSLGGSDRTWCGQSADPPGLFAKVKISETGFLEELFDLTKSASAYIFLNFQLPDSLNVFSNNGRMVQKLLPLNDQIVELTDILKNFDDYVKDAGGSTIELMKDIMELVKDINKVVTMLASGVNSIHNVQEYHGALLSLSRSIFAAIGRWNEFKGTAIPQISSFQNTIQDISGRLQQIQNDFHVVVKGFISNVKTIMHSVSGFGLRAQVQFPVSLLSSEEVTLELRVGQCSQLGQFKEFYDRFEGKQSVRGFVIIPKKIPFKYGTIDAVGGELVYALDDKDYLMRLVAEITLVGIYKVDVNLFLSEELIYFHARGSVWGVCTATVYAQVKLPADELNWRVVGNFDANSNKQSFNMMMVEAISNVAQEFGKSATDRLDNAQDRVREVQDEVTAAREWLSRRKADVDKANSAFDSAVQKLNSAKNAVRDKQASAENAKNTLRQKQRDVDNLCRIKSCREICVPGIKCSICHKKVGFVSVPYPCCSPTSCMTKVTDPVCIAANVACSAIRAAAFTALKLAEGVVTLAIRAMDVAVLALDEAQCVVDKARVVLDAAKFALDLAATTLDVAERALDGVILTLEGVKSVVAAGVEVYKFISDFDKPSIVTIRRAGFEVEISKEDVFVLEVEIEANIFLIGYRKLYVIIDFGKLERSLLSSADSIVKEFAKDLLPFRRKRELTGAISESINSTGDIIMSTIHISPETKFLRDRQAKTVSLDEKTKYRIHEFEEKCMNFTELSSFLNESLTTLYDIAKEWKQSLENTSNAIVMIDEVMLNVSEISINGSEINKTEALFNYNMTGDEIEFELMNIDLKRNPIMNETFNVIAAAKEVSLEELEIASDYRILEPWKEAMEKVTEEKFSEDECASFEDCLFLTFDRLVGLYEKVDLPNVDGMKSLIFKSRTQFSSMLRNDSLRLDDALAITGEILDILKETTETKIFCATPPVITLNPSNTTVIKGEDLSLSLNCEANSDPQPTYAWYKNGEVISTVSKTGLLVIKNIDDQARGWYKCKAGNHVINVTSAEAYVDVYEAPIVTIPKDRVVLEGHEPSLVFDCASTGWPLPTISWYFSKDSITYSKLPVTASSLSLYKPQLSESGWYKCEAINIAGKDLSAGFRLMVLGTSLALPSLSVSFEFFTSPRSENNYQNYASSAETEKSSIVKDRLLSSLGNLLGIDTNRFTFVELEKVHMNHGDISGMVSMKIIGRKNSNEGISRLPYRYLQDVFYDSQEELILMAMTLSEATLDEVHLFSVHGLSVKIKRESLHYGMDEPGCPKSQKASDYKYFLCADCIGDETGCDENEKETTPAGLSKHPDITPESLKQADTGVGIGHILLIAGAPVLVVVTGIIATVVLLKKKRSSKEDDTSLSESTSSDIGEMVIMGNTAGANPCTYECPSVFNSTNETA